MSKDKYDGTKVSVLKGLDAIRKRPGMYIGDVGEKGLHHCVFEVVDNSIDEAVAGYGKKIILTKQKNGGIKVEDFGRGMPVDKRSDGLSAATTLLTVLHAGAKFDKDTYKTSGGLHGIGIKATNATSKWLKLIVYKDGFQWEQEFEKGKPLYVIKKIGPTKKTGTTIEFIPDNLIFDNTEYNKDILIDRIRRASFLTKNIELVFIDEEKKEKETFMSKNGLSDMIDFLVPKENKLTKAMSFEGSSEKKGEVINKETGEKETNGIIEKFDIEVSFIYEKGYSTNINSYVNKILTPKGGVHEQGVLDALNSSLLKKVKETKVKTKREEEILKKVNIDDVREGLFLCISLSLYTEVVFEGQTKEKLSGQYLRPMIRELSKQKIEQFFKENPIITEKIVKKLITARKARESANRAKKIQRKKESEEIGSMLGKLSDCISNEPKECELFIVEGVSASGTSKQGRDNKFQAILPLKGKPINPLKNKLEDTFKNEEILSLKTALGCGYGDNVVLSKLRYHKVIIQNDADIDGCLRADTKVKLKDGSIKTIKELSKLYPVGGKSFKVWSYDIDLDEPVVGIAHSVRITKKVEKIYKIKFINDYEIFCTENHPFLNMCGTYYRADELKVGEYVQSIYFKNEKIVPLINNHRIKEIEILYTNEEVYDMTVDKYHNFGIVASEDNNALIFVHNSHIQQLLLTVFNTLFKPLLMEGYIYKAIPPLHRVKEGKESTYLNTDKDKQEFIERKRKELSKSIKSTKKYKNLDEKKQIDFLNEELEKGMKKYVFNRFKGLGEMNAEQLAETTMELKTRNIVQLKPNPIYDISDEYDLELEGIEKNQKEILEKIKLRRLDEKDIKNKKDTLPELNVDNIVALVSSNEGRAFREKFLLRNINN